MNFTAAIEQPDEDGLCVVTIYQGGMVFDRHYGIPCDQVNQWAAQEVECLQDAGAGCWR